MILASNIYGFTMAYLLGLFAVKLYDAKKDQKWSWFLSTINQGRRAAIQAKFITDAVFILIDYLLMGVIITGAIHKRKSIDIYYCDFIYFLYAYLIMGEK